MSIENSKCNCCGKLHEQYQGKKRRYCGACNTALRRVRNKIKGIDLLGGRCVKCGFRGHPAAFEFHHKDPSQKEFNFGNMANKAWKTLENELDKCELLCSNCHRMEHSTRYDKHIEEVDAFERRYESILLPNTRKFVEDALEQCVDFTFHFVEMSEPERNFGIVISARGVGYVLQNDSFGRPTEHIGIADGSYHSLDIEHQKKMKATIIDILERKYLGRYESDRKEFLNSDD